MTFINQELFQHRDLTNALLRLNSALVRHENMPSDVLVKGIQELTDTINRKMDKKIVGEIDSSGDNFAVADELYHPSTDIFDEKTNRIELVTVDKNEGFYFPNLDYEESDVTCTSVYRLRRGDRICAEIKNYHTYHIVDYTVTSKPYPVLNIDEFTSAGSYEGMSLYNNKFIEKLTTAGRVYRLSMEHYRYLTPSWKEQVTSRPLFSGVEKLFSMVDVTAEDELTTSGEVYEISYPNRGIKYNHEPDEITVGGEVYNIQFNWRPD